MDLGQITRVLVENIQDEGATRFYRMQSATTIRNRSSFEIYIDREYFPCGCAYLVDVKSGEAKFSFPCEKHKPLQGWLILL